MLVSKESAGAVRKIHTVLTDTLEYPNNLFRSFMDLFREASDKL